MLEICVDTADGLQAALAGGADRIELCAALSVGGLTPPLSLIALATEVAVPVHVMIRPRDGDFVYSPGEIGQMCADAAAVRNSGLTGIVLGASLPDGALDVETMRTVLAEKGDLAATLHRAFDLTPDPFVALDQAIDLGFTHLLTSGLAITAPEGADLIRELVARAAGRIHIMPGGGIRPDQVQAMMAQTGARQIHASGSVAGRAYAPDVTRFGFAADDHALMTDTDLIRALKAAMTGNG